MVTIRNDIESNGSANRADSAASVVEGTKNINQLANGSRRSTMGDIKQKAFNKKCVGFLALIVCVGVCFGVGMLFLYGHLVDRLNESANHGSMLHDKNGNPVKHLLTTTTSTTTTTTSPLSSSSSPSPTTSTVPTAVTEISPTTTSTESFIQPSTPGKRQEDDVFDLDSGLNDKGKAPVATPQSSMEITTARNAGMPPGWGKIQYSPPQGMGSNVQYVPSSGSGDYSGDDSDDDDVQNDAEGSGNHK